MIAPLSLPTPLLRSSAPAAPAPAPAPVPQEPAGPRELLDLSTIDTAAEAAQLPLLEPAFQLSLAAAVVNSLMGPSSERQEICVVNKFPGTCVDTLFTLDLKNQGSPLTVSGSFNGTPITGQANLGDTVQWQGATGDNVEEVAVGPSLDQEAIRIDGRFGTVPASLAISPLMNGEIFEGVLTTGSLGGYDYKCETRIADTNAVMNGRGATTMTSKGHVGELEIDKTYTITATDRTWMFEGKGVNAGVEQDVFACLSL